MSIVAVDQRLFSLRRLPRGSFDAGTAMFVKRVEQGGQRLTIYRDRSGRKLFVEHTGDRPSVAEIRSALAVQWDGAA